MQDDNPNDALNRVITLTKQGRRAEALTLLRDILRRDPEQVMAWKWFAYLSPDPQEALNAARYVRFLAPGDEWLRKVLPTLQARIKQPAPEPSSHEPPPEQADSARRPVWAAWILLAVLLCVGAATAGALIAGMLSPADPIEVDSLPRADVTPVATPEEEVAARSAPRELADAGSVFGPSVSVEESTHYYDIEGDTVMDVQLALENEGPVLSSGERAIAMTSYGMWVSWEAVSREDSCEVTEADITLELTYTYPRWEPGTFVEHNLDAEWDRFIAHVIDHEQHHGEIALACAYELASSLDAMAPPASCDEMENQIDALVDAVYMACEEQQNAFDADEGTTTFPLP